VVARRYRPQAFDQLVGQQHVAKALSNAIAANRVGHAYLFTGARGVGKTSAARILAKALNCEKGPTPTPCNVCELCQSISSGDDVDVLEIDGASNRGIDEIRQLRQNVNVRPSRSRFKIYIIDEVHMLTREAFNALLKTLEEPPEHVKFIFCTTEANKIPITILSRCQRFDFAGIQTASIAQRLRQIVDAEGVQADPEALETLARRAAGSMRDSQSLLEQLLAFSAGQITAAGVHAMLGTAADESLDRLVAHLVDRDAAAALADLDAALGQGVDVGQLLEQLLGYLRDGMVTAAGAGEGSLLYVSPGSRTHLMESSQRLGLHTILAAMQILDHTLARLRVSTQGRVLAELALVRISQLENLDDIALLISQLKSGAAVGLPERPAPAPVASAAPPVGPALKKNVLTTSDNPPPSEHPQPEANEQAEPASRPTGGVSLTAQNATQVWTQAISGLTGMAADYAREFDHVALAGPNHLVVTFKAGFAVAKNFCQRPEQSSRLDRALAELTGSRIRLEFAVREDTPSPDRPQAAAARAVSIHQRNMEIMQNPFVQRATELFGAQPVIERVKFADQGVREQE
jgi:DNA polymerase-3 subunit gamma/tau